MSLLAAACGDDDDDGEGAQPEDTETSAPADGAEGEQGGDIVLGAEQFPECINPLTQCSNSSWMHWAVVEHVLPRLMELDPDSNYVPSPVLDGDPEVSGEGASFTVTYTLRPEAAWDDGTPITCADIQFTHEAYLQTTGTVITRGYDQITSIEPVDGDEQVCAIQFNDTYAGWPDLFGGSSEYVLKADFFAGPDTANDLINEIPFSGGPWVLQSFDAAGEAVLVRNENYWDQERIPLLDSVTMRAQESQETEINALLAGEVAAIYPQPAPGLTEQLQAEDTMSVTFGAGNTYEVLWFTSESLIGGSNQELSDPLVREALMYAVDRQRIIDEVILALSPEAEILNCLGWVPTVGEWCDNTDFEDITFDPARVDELLTQAGYAKGPDGFYARDGERLSLTWQTVEGNARREQTQQLLIPAFAELGIEVVPNNFDADTLFQQVVPQRQTEIAEYAQVASPDPSVTTIFACQNIPTEENSFAGQNSVAWCNEEATDLMAQADAALDEADRLDLTHQIGDLLREDFVSLPLYQLPLISAYNTDLIDGPIDDYVNTSYSSFFNMYDWFVAS